MTQRFRNRTVIITGASAGIGAACARRFASEGANLVLAARNAERLNTLAKSLEERTQVITVPTDVSLRKDARALLEAGDQRFGRIDVLINNAGFNHRGAVEQISESDLARVLRVDLEAPMVLCRLALPYLRQAGGGALVNVASIAGQIPMPDEAAYSAAKAGLRAFTRALAEELEGSGITASMVSPGPVDTGFIMNDLDEVPDIVFAQPMSTADDIAVLVVESAADGRLERTHPRITGVTATLGYLFPALTRLLRPAMERRGREAKSRYRGRVG